MPAGKREGYHGPIGSFVAVASR